MTTTLISSDNYAAFYASDTTDTVNVSVEYSGQSTYYTNLPGIYNSIVSNIAALESQIATEYPGITPTVSSPLSVYYSGARSCNLTLDTQNSDFTNPGWVVA